jgi:hypothetical protein
MPTVNELLYSIVHSVGDVSLSPDPLRLSYRTVIKETINRVVTQPENDPLELIKKAVIEKVTEADRVSVEALIIEELRRLHEGVLARYGLRPSEFERWKSKASRRTT